MPGEIYVVMTGNDNELWPECLERNFVAMGFDTPYFDAWHGGDYDAYLALEYAAATTGTPDADIKARATLWFNRATRLRESVGDLWLHRDGAALYWAETVDAPPVFDPLSDKVIIAKPTTNWSKRNRKTVALGWDSIHPKAKDYLAPSRPCFMSPTAT
ncbi:MAG: hypothetical protein E5Y06_12355 [Mesorhizobium sp.]|uniref:hypothetical protein n=1 Tax=Mesorhizobium sp. TaxID=1871066 RepID=UPI001221CF80|nr:hypothetical protein [Mesorhizobium sp.]TIN95536.1 MAG: hypothetical protein E5Y06_12355 [Mesorhizobium sp.]TJU97183.1 MAG: hypothetical protein E5Y08_18945 [Mesorhizobium sp.]